MYSQITANKRKTLLLVALFVFFTLSLGWLIGYLEGDAVTFLVIAFVYALVMAATSFYSGDKIALWTAGARPIKKADNPYVYRLVENLCIASGLPVPKVHIISDPAINAFATGRNPETASIAVTTGAIAKLTNEELEGVLAHELSHIKNYDIRLMTIVVLLVGVVALLADFLWRFHFFGRRRERETHSQLDVLIITLGLILAILSPLIAQLIKLAVSRRREYLADASGALLTRFPEGLARALQKIAAEPAGVARATTATAHLYIAEPFGKRFSALFSTHPPIEERIRLLREMTI